MAQQVTSGLNAAQTIEHPGTGSLFALSVEAKLTRACLLENVDGQYRLASWLSIQRTPGEEMTEQVANTCRRLGARLNRRLWDEGRDEPLLQSEDPVRFPVLEQIAVTASPRAHVRVWVAGLSHSLSLTAARQAVGSGPTQWIGCTQLTVDINSGQLATELNEAHPEALVIVGGYDDPTPDAQRSILLLCKALGQALARIPPAQRPAIFYAGNRWAAAAAENLLRSGEGHIQLQVLANVQPAPDQVHQAELAVALGYHYWRLCERTPDFVKLSRWVTSPGQITNLESSFAQLTQAWMTYQQLPELHTLYCAEDWWLHVWASQALNGVRMRFVQPKTRPPDLADWPPLQLVSGEWPVRLWPLPAVAWCDHGCLAPLLAGIGQVAPLAMLQVLTLDLLEPCGKRGGS
ncbi:MAG: glutamate mutase L [Chloroflexi bacterium]|nr:glutamate mutase L [Chloroflexota bacterium]